MGQYHISDRTECDNRRKKTTENKIFPTPPWWGQGFSHQMASVWKRKRRSEEGERRTENQTETEDNVREKETHPEKDDKSG